MQVGQYLRKNIICKNMASKLCYHHKLLKGISSLRLHHVRNNPSNSKKSSKLKSLLTSRKLEYIMEAHNGLSARIVEEAGFNVLMGLQSLLN